MFLKILLLFTSLLLIACSDVKSTRYKDTSHLELPPMMEIVKKPKTVVVETDDVEQTGLGSNVSLGGSEQFPVIKIKKLFDRSWVLVEQALKLSEIEITDKNREQGVFYVLYDPDVKKSGDTNVIDSMTFFLFKDDYAEATYKLNVAWKETATEVSVELADVISTEMLDDQEDLEEAEGSVDSGKKLLLNLYGTIRDDLPLD